jgi:hypothetical protein
VMLSQVLARTLRCLRITVQRSLILYSFLVNLHKQRVIR